MSRREINDCGVFSDEIINEIMKVYSFSWYTSVSGQCLSRELSEHFDAYIQEAETLSKHCLEAAVDNG